MMFQSKDDKAGTKRARRHCKKTALSTARLPPSLLDVALTDCSGTVPVVSPVLSNHSIPSLQRIKPEQFAKDWVSPQCNSRMPKLKLRRRILHRDVDYCVKAKKEQKDEEDCPRCKSTVQRRKATTSSTVSTAVGGETIIVSPTRSGIGEVLVYDTPLQQQGLTLKQKLLKSQLVLP